MTVFSMKSEKQAEKHEIMGARRGLTRKRQMMKKFDKNIKIGVTFINVTVYETII